MDNHALVTAEVLNNKQAPNCEARTKRKTKWTSRSKEHKSESAQSIMCSPEFQIDTDKWRDFLKKKTLPITISCKRQTAAKGSRSWGIRCVCIYFAQPNSYKYSGPTPTETSTSWSQKKSQQAQSDPLGLQSANGEHKVPM